MSKRYDIIHNEIEFIIEEIRRMENRCWFPFKDYYIRKKIDEGKARFVELDKAETMLINAIEYFDVNTNYIENMKYVTEKRTRDLRKIFCELTIKYEPKNETSGINLL